MHMLEPVPQSRSPETSGAHVRRSSTPGAEPEALPDLLLIEGARAGDTRAIEALIRRYGRRLFRVARSVLLDEERAEAAVLETYLAAFGDLSRYELSGKFAAWLTRLVFNEARALRADRSRAGCAVAPPASGAASAPVDAANGANGTNGAGLHERRALEQAIERLPDVFRTVFVLRVVEGISGIETAASLALHETTVRTRLYRALRRLAPEIVQRVRATPELLPLTAERAERIVKGVLAALPHGSMLTISASPP
jgi:RNA polymerase sigma-70 factor (ECF subfamily)